MEIETLRWRDILPYITSTSGLLGNMTKPALFMYCSSLTYLFNMKSYVGRQVILHLSISWADTPIQLHRIGETDQAVIWSYICLCFRALMLESSLRQSSLHSCYFTDYKEGGFVPMDHFHTHYHRSRAYIQSEISSPLTCIWNHSLLGAV